MIKDLAIVFEEEAFTEKAHALAAELQLPINSQSPHKLLITAEKLVLKMECFSPLYADFSIKTWQKRRDAGKKQALVRACKPGPRVKIVDATAGWGRDAAVLASFGAEVTMLERDPIIAALLADGLQRQGERDRQHLKLQLHQVDSLEWLQSLKEEAYPDVIYMDPMHPERQKSSLVKKDLQALQCLLGPDKDPESLLQVALTKTRHRVVVKWPQHLAPLKPPTYSLPGKVVRFDIYHPLY